MGKVISKWNLESKQSNSGPSAYITCSDINIAGLYNGKFEDYTAFKYREASSDAAVDQ